MTLRCNTFVRYREIWHPHSWEYTELSQKKTHAGRCKPGGGCRNVRLHAQHHSSTRRMGEGRDNPPQFPNSYAGWLDYRPADWVFLRDLWLRMVISVVSAKDLSGARPAGCWNDDFLLVKRARGQRAKLLVFGFVWIHAISSQNERRKRTSLSQNSMVRTVLIHDRGSQLVSLVQDANCFFNLIFGLEGGRMRHQDGCWSTQEKVIEQSHLLFLFNTPPRKTWIAESQASMCPRDIADLQDTCMIALVKNPEDIQWYLYLVYKIRRLIAGFLERWIDK